MKRKELSLVFLLFFVITAVFFYKTILHGFIPFPGDLLIAEYNPWKTFSYIGYAPSGYPDKAQYFDVLRQMYPWTTLVLHLFSQQQLPLWNPYNFSGSPLLANFQSAAFYPLHIVYLFLPQKVGWSVLVFLQPFLAGLFTYFFARKIGIGKFGSFFAGCSWSFSSFFSVWLEYNTVLHIALWLPLILLACEYLLKKISAWWTAIFILSLSFSLFAGHPQVAVYLYLFVFAYIFCRVFTNEKIKSKGKLLSFFFLSFLLSLGIGAIQLIPGFELITLSARAGHDYQTLLTKLLIQPFQLIMFFVPDFFGNPATRNYWIADTYVGKVTTIGVVPILFIIFSFTQWKNIFVRFFTWSALVVLVLVTNNPLTQLLYHASIPFFSSSSPTLSVFLFVFSMSILAGIGIDVFIKNNFSLKRFLLLISPLILIFFLLWVSVLLGKKGILLNPDAASIALRNLLYPSLILFITLCLMIFFILKKKFVYFVLVCLIVLQLFDLFRAFNKFNPFVPQQLMYPQTSVTTYLQNSAGINRFWGYGNAIIEPNIATQFNIFSPEGYDPLYPKWYGEFIQASWNGKIVTTFTDRTRSDAQIAPASNTDFATNSDRLKVLNILGVKYILDRIENASTEKTFPSNFHNVFNDSGWKIYENTNALPRIFLTTSYDTYKTKEEFDKKFFNTDAPTTIFLENTVLPSLTAKKMDVSLISYKPNEINIKTITDGSALLFLSDTYYPGWKAYIDGKEVLIYKADYAFRSLIVPSGIHTVLFVYQPDSFYFGLKITILSVCLLVVFLFVAKKFTYEK